MFNDNMNDNNGNNGNRGKFSDRLNKIRRKKNKKFFLLNENIDANKDNIVLNTGRNILKIVLAFPSVIYSSFSSNVGRCHSDISSDHNTSNIVSQKNDKINQIRQMNISLLKEQRDFYLKNRNNNNISSESSNNNENRIIVLQKQIIDLIKKKLVENINQLEELYSELYLLKELNGEDIYLLSCQENIKEIKRLLSKINSLKNKYDFLKDNVDFEYMLEYDDNILIDKILELKQLCFDEDIKYTVDCYKILDEYKFLYLKIDKLQEETIKYEKYKKDMVIELMQRDIDFDKLKNDVYDIDKENNRYNEFVRQQEIFLSDLNDKILNISSYDVVNYRLKGFNQLLGNSFKYLGLLLLHPFKSFLPGVATHTLITKNTIHNLYNSLELEENRKIVYEAIDYSTEINNAINNLDFTSSLIDSTLGDIARLKVRYQNEFAMYEYSIPDYQNMIKKINKMENAVLGNKIKVMRMQEKMKEKERENKCKLKKIKKLNNSQNNNKKIA